MLFRRVDIAKFWYRLFLGEPRFALEDWGEGLDKTVLCAFGLEVRVLLQVLKQFGICRVELTPFLGVGEYLVGLLDTLEERIVVGVEVDASEQRTGALWGCRRHLLVGVVLEYLFAVYIEMSAQIQIRVWRKGVRATLICAGVALCLR